MIWFLIVLLTIFIFLLLLLLFVRFKVFISYLFVFEGSHVLEVEFSILKITLMRRRINFRKQKTMNKSLKEISSQLKGRERKSLRKVEVNYLSWTTSIGTGDAIATGITTGGLWTIKELVISYINHYIKINCKPKLEIKPNFQALGFQTSVDCKLSLSILTIIRLDKNLLKNLYRKRTFNVLQ